MEMVERFKKTENVRLPEDLNYSEIKVFHAGLRKAHQNKARSLGQASRISGITPCGNIIAVVYCGKEKARRLLL
jgi:tRNA U34 5-carboxymethylaminomethyl modifying enzyme MnmG/GidA